MLFSVPASKLKLLPDKATIKIGIPSFEILFRSRQGAIMGSHPDTMVILQLLMVDLSLQKST